MHDDSQNDWDQLFDQLPVDSTIGQLQRESARRRMFDAFDEQSPLPIRPLTPHSLGHTLMKYKIPHGIAAILLVASGFWLLPLVSTPAFALDDTVQEFMKVRTARYHSMVMVEGQPPLQSRGFYHAPAHLREEFDGFTSITDWSARKKIGLETKSLKATVYHLNRLPEELKNGMRDGNWFEGIRHLLRDASTNPDSSVVELGAKQIDGRKVVGFRLEIPATPMTVWADPQTRLPVRIESTFVGPPKTEVVMTHFEFDIELDRSLFSVEVPDGYTVTDVDIDLSAATESNLISALRMCCEVSDGEFPTGFDAVSVGKYSAMYLVHQGAGSDTGPTGEQLQEITKIARGFQFAMMLPRDAEVHYAGAGAKQGDPERPVFWYRPSRSEGFRVIFADFSIREMDEPPKIDGAIRLNK